MKFDHQWHRYFIDCGSWAVEKFVCTRCDAQKIQHTQFKLFATGISARKTSYYRLGESFKRQPRCVQCIERHAI